MAEFNGYNDKMYWDNVHTILNYFKKFELFWLTIILTLVNLFVSKKEYTSNAIKLAVFYTSFFVFSVFLLARIPNFIYTRYIIFLQPILTIVILINLFNIIIILSRNSSSLINFKTRLVLSLFSIVIIIQVKNNNANIKGYLLHLSTAYKGPLDYTIPYIKKQFHKTDTLTIAANYEETSYMYYLSSKVVLGFVGNNLENDSKEEPDIIAYRKPWGNFQEIIQGYFQKNKYDKITFPVYDNPVNNIPELNFMPTFNHQFKNKMARNEQESTELFVIKRNL